MRIKSELEAKLGREARLSSSPQSPDVAGRHRRLRTRVLPVQSLQQPLGDDGFALESTIGGESIENVIVERTALRSALRELPERERSVILLRYYRGMTQERVARALAVSQVQVSRIERRAIGMLREKIG